MKRYDEIWNYTRKNAEILEKYRRNTGEILDNSDTIRIIALVRCVVYVGMSFCEKCR